MSTRIDPYTIAGAALFAAGALIAAYVATEPDATDSQQKRSGHSAQVGPRQRE